MVTYGMVTYDMGAPLGCGSFRHHGDFFWVSLAFFFSGGVDAVPQTFALLAPPKRTG